MNFKNTPDDGMGFIYILSNPAFPNLYKVGFTAQSIKDRVKDLNSTGVPDKFKIEYLFEIPKKYLQHVEASAHAELQYKKLHHNKEFFKDLIECKNVVLETIEKIIGEVPTEHIDEYKKRREAKEFEKIKKEQQAKEQQEIIEELELNLKKLNDFGYHLSSEYQRKELPLGEVGSFGHAWIVFITTLFFTFVILNFSIKYNWFLQWSLAWIPLICAGFYIWNRWNKESDVNFYIESNFPYLYIDDLINKSDKYKKLIESIVENSKNNSTYEFLNSTEKDKLKDKIKDKDIDDIIKTLEKYN